MALSKWFSEFPPLERDTQKDELRRWRGRLGSAYTLEQLCAPLIERACPALAALWRARGFAPLPEATLRKHYGFTDAALTELAQTLPLSALAKTEFDGDEHEARRAFAQLAPLLDSLAPKDERKAQGFFLTPPPIARQLVAGLFADEAVPHYLRLYEAGTGPGVLSLLAFAHWQERLPSSPATRAERLSAFVSGSRFVERHAGLAALASLSWLATLLAEPCLESMRIAHWPVRCADALAEEPCGGFTHAIGNPPFLGEKQSGGVLKEAIAAAPWLAKAYRGKADYAYLFIWQSVLQLAPGGRLALLTPAYWPTADGANALRAALGDACSALTLEKAASGIYSAPGLDACCVFARRNETQRESRHGLSFHIAGPEKKLSARLDTLSKQGRPLAELFDVRTGIQSGADRLSVRNRQRFALTAPNGAGIFVLSAAEFDALEPRLNEEERALVMPLGKTPETGPFIFARKTPESKLLYLDGRTPLKRLPALAEHLAPFRALLEERRECREGRMPWWRLHWPREKESFLQESLLVPQRAPRMRAALAPGASFTSVDVYHLLPRAENHVPLLAWLAVLHSQTVQDWLFWRGKRKGPLLELYHTPLSALPLPALRPQTPAALALNELGEACYAFWMRAWQEAKGQGAWPAEAAKLASGAAWRALQKALDEQSEAAYESCG